MGNIKKKIGRPTKMTPEAIGKLEQAFAIGATDLEACLFADIGKDVLYDYINRNPEFHDRKEALKRKPVLLAKTNIIKNLQNADIDTSKWYLERKARDEFATRQEVETSGKVSVLNISVEEDKADDIDKCNH